MFLESESLKRAISTLREAEKFSRRQASLYTPQSSRYWAMRLSFSSHAPPSSASLESLRGLLVQRGNHEAEPQGYHISRTRFHAAVLLIAMTFVVYRRIDAGRGVREANNLDV
jgi:hypothetical protein